MDYVPEDIIVIYCRICDAEWNVIAGDESTCPVCGHEVDDETTLELKYLMKETK